MNKDRAEERAIEEQIWGLSESIASVLRAKGGMVNDSALLPRLGFDAVRVVTDREESGFLLLCADNKWQETSLFFGHQLEDPNVDDLLEVYAKLTYEDYPSLFSGGKYEDIMQKRKEFVKSRRSQLLRNFKAALESAYKGLASNN